MRKLLRSAIGCVALIFVCGVIQGDAMDNFAKALQQLASPRTGGSFGDEGEYGPSTEPKPGKIDPFYKKYSTFEKRINYLDKEWDKYETLGEEGKKELVKHTTDTFILAAGDGAKELIGILRDLVTSMPGMSDDAVMVKIPYEYIIDVGYLVIYLVDEVAKESYRKNLTKLFWVAKCFPLSDTDRDKATSKGEPICKNSGCLSAKECTSAFFYYLAEILDVWAKVFAEGITAYGGKIDGITTIIGRIAKVAGVTDTEKAGIVKIFNETGAFLTKTVKTSRTMHKAFTKISKKSGSK